MILLLFEAQKKTEVARKYRVSSATRAVRPQLDEMPVESIGYGALESSLRKAFLQGRDF